MFAAVLGAGLDGIENDYELMEMVVTDPHVDERWERLPGDIEGAIANFDTPFNRSIFGDVFVDNFIIMQQREADAFAAEADHSQDVTDWEIARYRAVV